MKTKGKILIGVSVVVAIAVAYYLFSDKSETQEIKAETISITKGNVSKSITATGTVEPINQVEVGTQVSGEVEKIYVDYNSVVSKGQLIAELDKTNLKASLVQAQATYNSAVDKEVYMKGIYERQQKLYDKKLLSKADYDKALYDYKTAKNTAVQRQSDLQRAKTNLSYANIYSPINGVVLSRAIDEGQTVAASFNTPTLFTIAQDLKQMQVEADVDEADIGGIKVGQRVTFTVDAYVGETFNGVVTQVRLDPTVISNVVTYVVVIKADNPELKLKPGLTATVTIYTLELNNVMTAESKAINFTPNRTTLMSYFEQNNIEFTGRPPRRNDNAKRQTPPSDENNQKAGKKSLSSNERIVWVLKNNKEIKPTKIKIGESDGVNVQIVSGVNIDDKLVYKLSGISSKRISSESSAEESPFMPKRPGSNRKKK